MNNQMQQFAEGGLEDEGGEIDEVSGNEVPIGGTKEGVRDDIPANVSEGEFIFPADVVRFIGLDKLMSIRQKAKMGLQKMEDMGQMGNSDEATIPDDMPFGMADIMVIGDKGEPMEFANGGFVPSYAPGGLLGSVASNLLGGQEYDNQQLVGLPGPDETTNAGLMPPVQTTPMPNVTPSGMEELQTAYVPTTGTEEIDYDAYMNSVTTLTKEYRNAAGESIIVTFINGLPTLPIPDGYTLYTAEAGSGGGTTSLAGQVIAQSNTSGTGTNNRQRDDSPEVKTGFAPDPIDYRGMSPENFAAQMKLESSGVQQFGRAVGIAISSLVPLGGTAIYAGMRSHARKSEARLNNMIESATGSYKNELITIRDDFLKSYSLKPSDKINAFASAIDSYLTKDGYDEKSIATATEAVVTSNDETPSYYQMAGADPFDRPVAVKTQEELEAKRIKEENDRRLRAEEEAADARQNNAFQNAANELTPNDDKEYRKGILISTKEGDNNKQINTAYQDAANLATPFDGDKYEGGILRNSKGEKINSAYQNAANELTKSDGRSYINGDLIDDKTKLAYIAKDRSTSGRRMRDPFATVAVPDGNNGMDALMARHQSNIDEGLIPGQGPNAPDFKAKQAADNARMAADIAAHRAYMGTPAPVAPVVAQSNNSGSFNSTAADVQASFHSPTISDRPRSRPTGKKSVSNKPFKAEGGLIQKPAKSKKPTTPKTKKRGLAARK